MPRVVDESKHMKDLTLRDLYTLCAERAYDVEILVKCDGRGYFAFRRVIDGRAVHAEFDFEREAEHLPDAVVDAVRERLVKP